MIISSLELSEEASFLFPKRHCGRKIRIRNPREQFDWVGKDKDRIQEESFVDATDNSEKTLLHLQVRDRQP